MFVDGVGVRLGQVCWNSNGLALVSLDHSKKAEINSSAMIIETINGLAREILFMIIIHTGSH